jgi:cell division protein FtsZ
LTRNPPSTPDAAPDPKSEETTMALNLSMPAAHFELKPRITVIGVGGAGGNAVNNMIRSKLEGVDFVVANTDAQALSQNLAETRIQLGIGTTQGLGAGSRPDIGRAAAEEAIEDMARAVEGSHMVFIAAGMGGGTGTGAAPVIARAAREHGMLTVGVVTKPFNFEGQHRMRLAEAGIAELQQHVDTLIIIPNQNLFRIANERTTFADAFKMADDVLYSGVRGVTDLMLMPGLINLDFADIRTVMGEMGKAMMGTGEAEGDNRAVDAAQKAISNPLLDDVSMKGARGVLINITGGADMTLFEVDEAANRIRDEVDPDANIIFGSTFDEGMSGRMRVSVVATGIDVGAREQEKPTVISFAKQRAAAQRGTPPASAARAEAAPRAEVQPRPEPTPRAEAQPRVEAAPREEAPPLLQHVEREAPPAAAPVAAPAPAPQPAPAARANETSFIPPRTVEPAPEPRQRSPRGAPAVDPLAAADLANGAVPAARKPAPGLGSRIFAKVTGLGGRERPAAGERAAPAAKPEPQFQAPAARAPQPAQPKLGGLEPPPAPAPQSHQDDLLDIPAFLRRQAN